MEPRYTIAWLLCGLLAGATGASAAPVQWKVEDGGNDHFYNVVAVSRGVSWPDANAAAIARGSGWHLVTITSAEENAFVYGLVAGKPQFWKCCDGGDATGPWIGARKQGAGGFGWVTGEAFDYASWAAGQPLGIGDRVVLFAAEAPDAPTWANTGGAREDVLSYVIETEAEERIVALLEEPSCSGSSGISNIRGFAFSSINGITIDRVVEVTFDRDTPQEAETDLACCSSRGDVRAVFPVAPPRMPAGAGQAHDQPAVRKLDRPDADRHPGVRLALRAPRGPLPPRGRVRLGERRGRL
jgi:hypothetical protein